MKRTKVVLEEMRAIQKVVNGNWYLKVKRKKEKKIQLAVSGSSLFSVKLIRVENDVTPSFCSRIHSIDDGVNFAPVIR